MNLKLDTSYLHATVDKILLLGDATMVTPVREVVTQVMFQILDQGFILHPGAYMRDFWNFMDITVVSCALISFYHTIA